MTELRAITIDSLTTLDMDDAIWVERAQDHWKILVAIADTAPVIEVGSRVDDRAKDLVTTRYFPTSTLPMLPRHFADHDLSLWPAKPRQVVAIEIKLSQTLEVLECVPRLTTLVSQAKLAYEDTPGILKDSTSPWHSMLKQAVEVAMALLEKRRNQGAMAIYDLNYGWVTTEEGYIRKLASHELTVGYIIVQELMILANAQLAEFAVKRDIPVLFRNHVASSAAPDRVELIRQLNDAIHAPVENLDVLRQRTHMLLSKATYDGSLLGHYGLNLPAYLHFTSPIRRYPDLVNHRQVRAHLTGKPFPYTREQLDEIGKHCTKVLQELRDSKADHMKEKAEARAHRSIERGRLINLNDKELERVVKLASRSGMEAPEVFPEEFARRIEEDRFPLICAAVVFVEAPNDKEGWTKLRAQLLNYLAWKPELAVSVMNLATQMNSKEWPSPEYDDSVLSLDPPMFRATAVTRGKTGVGSGPTKKAARQQAVLHLLGRLVGLDLPQVPPLPKEAPEPKVVIDGKDPISALQEWTVAHRVGGPKYTFNQTGASHTPTFTCRCECSGVAAEGKAASKQDAKREAARKVLKALTEAHDSDLRPRPSPDEDGAVHLPGRSDPPRS